METGVTLPPCGREHRYPQRVKDVALQEWAFRQSRDFDQTREALFGYAADEGWACVPDVRTLRYWAKRDDWPGECARMLRSIAPDMAARAVVDLIMAAMDGAAYVREVASGRITKPNSVRNLTSWAAIRAAGLDALARAELLGATRGVLWQDATLPLPDDGVPVLTHSPDAVPVDSQAAVLAAVLASRSEPSPS